MPLFDTQGGGDTAAPHLVRETKVGGYALGL